MIGKLSGFSLNNDGSQNITVTVGADFSSQYDELKDKEIEVDIKKASRKRSQDANNYFWFLCSEIAKKTSKYSKDGKNEVYREAIQAKGEFDPMMIRADAVERFLNRWSDRGTGWFAEVIDDYKQNYKIVHAYYGSSTYSTAAMSRIIDYVIMIAEDLGIPTITEKEKEKLLGRWTVKQEKRNTDG